MFFVFFFASNLARFLLSICYTQYNNKTFTRYTLFWVRWGGEILRPFFPDHPIDLFMNILCIVITFIIYLQTQRLMNLRVTYIGGHFWGLVKKAPRIALASLLYRRWNAFFVTCMYCRRRLYCHGNRKGFWMNYSCLSL